MRCVHIVYMEPKGHQFFLHRVNSLLVPNRQYVIGVCIDLCLQCLTVEQWLPMHILYTIKLIIVHNTEGHTACLKYMQHTLMIFGKQVKPYFEQLSKMHQSFFLFSILNFMQSLLWTHCVDLVLVITCISNVIMLQLYYILERDEFDVLLILSSIYSVHGTHKMVIQTCQIYFSDMISSFQFYSVFI